MPPIPQIGSFTAAGACQTMRSAIGGSPGPESPPSPFHSTGRRVSGSTSSAWTALISESPSAPSPFAHPRHLGDVGDVGRELHEQRQRGRPRAPRAPAAPSTTGSWPNSMPPLFTCGQRRVDLERRDPGTPRQALAHLGVAVDLGLEDARDDRRRPPARAGSFSRTKASTPTFSRLIEFSMPGGDLGDARRRVPVARLEGQALRDEAAEAPQVEERLELEAVAEGARRREHRIAQRGAPRAPRARSTSAGVTAGPPRRAPRRRRPGRRDTPARSRPRRAARRSRGRRRSRRPCGSRARATQGRPRRGGELRGAPHHRRRAAGVDRGRGRPARASARAAPSRARGARRCRPRVARRSSTPSAANAVDGHQVRRAPRAEEHARRARAPRARRELEERGDAGAAADEQRARAPRRAAESRTRGARRPARARPGGRRRAARCRARSPCRATSSAAPSRRKTAIGRGSSGSKRGAAGSAPGESITNCPGAEAGQPAPTSRRSRRFGAADRGVLEHRGVDARERERSRSRRLPRERRSGCARRAGPRPRRRG